MASDAKQAWLTAGFKILEESGPAALTIDELTRRLGLTKGSYYHHFKSREGYVDALMAYWEEEMTLRIIRKADTAATNAEKARTLTLLTMPLHESNLEVHIRAWSLADPQVREYVRRVDKARFEYVAKVAAHLAKDPARGRRVARIIYAVFVGAQQMLPPIHGKELISVYADLEKLYEL